MTFVRWKDFIESCAYIEWKRMLSQFAINNDIPLKGLIVKYAQIHKNVVLTRYTKCAFATPCNNSRLYGRTLCSKHFDRVENAANLNEFDEDQRIIQRLFNINLSGVTEVPPDAPPDAPRPAPFASTLLQLVRNEIQRKIDSLLKHLFKKFPQNAFNFQNMRLVENVKEESKEALFSKTIIVSDNKLLCCAIIGRKKGYKRCSNYIAKCDVLKEIFCAKHRDETKRKGDINHNSNLLLETVELKPTSHVKTSHQQDGEITIMSEIAVTDMFTFV